MTEMIMGGEAFNIIVEGAANAPAILLSHALGTNLHVFDKQVPALTRHFRVVRYDSRGHGGSVVSPGPYSISQLGHDALAILDALRLEKVHWIGLSEGGMVGLWLLANAPERIDRAILADTAAHIGGEIWNERIKTVREKGMAGLAASLIDNWFTRRFREHHQEEVRHFEDVLLAMNPESYAAHCAAIRDADLRSGLRAINHPVLVVVGRHDPVAPPGVAALIASSMNSAKLITLEAAHLSPVEAAEAFNRAAIEFLTGQGERPADMKPDDTKPPEPPHVEPPRPPQPRPPQPAAAAHPAPAPAPIPPRPQPAPVAERPIPRPIPPPVAPAKPGAPAAPAKPAAAPAPAKPAPAAAKPKRPAKKAAPKKAAAKKARKATKKAAAKKPAHKVAAKKHAVKKAAKKPTRKIAAKKSAARKASKKAKKSPAKKSARKTRGRKR
jgi:3-oxoadipate enol-lactonase